MSPPARLRKERADELAESLRLFAALSYERGPSMLELMRAQGLSSSSVAAHRMNLLEELGWIEPVPLPYLGAYNDRGYRLTAAGRGSGRARLDALNAAAAEGGRDGGTEVE